MRSATKWWACGWLLSALASGAAEAPALPQDVVQEIGRQIARLESSDFDEREAGLKKLRAMPREAVGHLKELLAGRDRKLSAEARGRIAMVINELEAQRLSGEAAEGSMVRLALQDAGPEEILAELGRQLKLDRPLALPRKLKAAPKEDFSFNGAYWDAVDSLLKRYPPLADEAWQRESLETHRYINRLTAADFDPAALPHANAGICRVRAGRVALERLAGGQCLLLTLVPLVEPRFEVEYLSVHVDKVLLDAARSLKPQRLGAATRAKAMRGGWGDIQVWVGNPENQASFMYSPAAEATFSMLADEMAPADRGVTISGELELGVREMEFETKTIRQLAQSCKLSNGITLTVREANNVWEVDGVLAPEGRGVDAGQACTTCHFLDANDVCLKVSNAGWRHKGGGRNFEVTATYKVEGRPAKVRIAVPGKLREVLVPFTLKDVPLPVQGGR